MLESKVKRYSTNKIDMIIPFLLNQYSSDQQEQPVYHHSPSSRLKRNSVPSQQQKSNMSKEFQHLYKIYHTKPSKNLGRTKIIYLSQPSTKPRSQMKKSLVKQSSPLTNSSFSKKTKISQFIKTQSQVNYVATSDFSLGIKERSQRQLQKSKSHKNVKGETPILGIKFKKSKEQADTSDVKNQVSENARAPSAYFRRDFRKNIKHLRERKQKEKLKCLNVDSIVNRRCKNFSQLISEYTRRMNISQQSKLFIFDSQDLWMKRILLERGWVENGNLASKAFHLYWSNKIYKDSLFSTQFSNHYPSSYSLTTKEGLYKLLKKYGLTYLQPMTFDLSSQKQQFVREYNKTHFVCSLRKLLEACEFEDPIFDMNINELMKEIKRLRSIEEEKNVIKDEREKGTIKVIEYCQQLLCNNLQSYDLLLVDTISRTLRQTKLNEAEEEAIRVIRDIEGFLAKEAIIRNYHTIGLENVWLTKSKISSKGVGIALHSQLESILKQDNKLAQKYIEKPLIFQQAPFNGRKFDLRVWVFIAGSIPEVYYQQKFYGRICFQSYSLDPLGLKNESIHLTNYSQNKQKFFKTHQLSDSIVFPSDLFANVKRSLDFQYNTKFYNDFQRMLKKLMPIFKRQLASKDTANSFELFGFDILLDSALHMHLLEINMSAACQQRHPSLTEMLESMGRGMLNILECRDTSQQIQLHGWRAIK